MAKEFVRNIKETKLRGKNIEPLYTNEQNDLLSDKKHAYIRNNDYYFPLTQAILDLASANDDGKNPVKPKLNIDGKENKVTLEWDTKALGNNFVERTPITLTVDDEFNQIIIGIDQEALYRFIKPYFKSSKDITVDFDDKEQTIAYRLDDQAFFERLVSHFKDGNGLDFVIDNEFKTVHYNLKDDKIKSIIFDTVVPKDDDLAVEQEDGKLLIDLSDKTTQLLADHSANIEQHNSDIQNLKIEVDGHTENIKNIRTLTNRHTAVLDDTNQAIDEIKQYFYDNPITNGLELILEQYHDKEVTKINLERYTQDFIEDFPGDEPPSFYELTLFEEILTGGTGTSRIPKEVLIFFVDKDKNTYVLNKTKSYNQNNFSSFNEVRKDYLDKYTKKLESLSIQSDKDGIFRTEFDPDNISDVIKDLYTISTLERI